jgi:uncharacterized protein (TIGR03382 family)
MFHKTTILAATALAALLPLGAAHAFSEPLDIQLSYTVNTAGDLPEITNIITFNSYASGGTGSWFAAMVPANSRSYTIVDPFLKSSANAPLDGLMLGLVKDLPGDAFGGEEHVVLMLSNEAASAAEDIAWGTLFRDTLEADIIDALHTNTSGLPWEVIQPEIDKLYTFAMVNARTGILGTVQQPIDAWFTLPGVGPGEVATAGFKVMAFSNGQILGDGVLTVSSVPEPGPAAMLAVGLAALGWMARRRKA